MFEGDYTYIYSYIYKYLCTHESTNSDNKYVRYLYVYIQVKPDEVDYALYSLNVCSYLWNKVVYHCQLIDLHSNREWYQIKNSFREIVKNK